MRRFRNHKKGVSNVYGYLLAFLISFCVMTLALDQKTNLEEEKRNQAAALKAQVLAAQVADLIVDAGTLLNEIKFDGTDDGLKFDEQSVITNMDDFSSFVVAKSDTTAGTRIALSVSDDSPDASRWYSPILFAGNFRFGYGASTFAVSLGVADINEHLFSSIAGSTTAEAWKDGASGGSVSSTTTAPSPVAGINLGGSNSGLILERLH